MCGLTIWLKPPQAPVETLLGLDAAAATVRHRGPDASETLVRDDVRMDFHRLRVNDLSAAGMQPFQRGSLAVMVNGEIYNSTALRRSLVSPPETPFRSSSDCEVILHLLAQGTLRFHTLCDHIDGVFAIAAYDFRSRTLYLARDPFGVRSLYVGRRRHRDPRRCLVWAAASEARALVAAGCDLIRPFPPGFAATLSADGGEQWRPHHIGFARPQLFPLRTNVTDDDARARLRELLGAAVAKRLQLDRFPVGCFLSGGVDSSLVAALVVRHLRATGRAAPADVHTFSIGQAGSEDLRCARLVADHLGTTHHEVVVTAEQMLAHVPSVVRDLETWDTTTVRAATGHTMLADYVRDQTDVRVVFSGEGADELFGSYMYFRRAPSAHAFRIESLRLCRDLHRFDVLRVEKSCATRGLECRVPFLDESFAHAVLRMPPAQRGLRAGAEKWLLRSAFDGDGDGRPSCDADTDADDAPRRRLLPAEVLWRRKEAFSDGVSGTATTDPDDQENQPPSWFQQVQRHAGGSLTAERAWYRSLFDRCHPNGVGAHLIPYEWQPQWSGDDPDPSARALPEYDIQDR